MLDLTANNCCSRGEGGGEGGKGEGGRGGRGGGGGGGGGVGKKRWRRRRRGRENEEKGGMRNGGDAMLSEQVLCNGVSTVSKGILRVGTYSVFLVSS